MSTPARYADVALATTTALRSAIFTYALTPETYSEAAPGTVVEVPFRGKVLSGILTVLRTRLPESLSDKSIRPIRRVLSREPLLDDRELRYREELARHLSTPLHRILTHQLPPKTFLKKFRRTIEPNPHPLPHDSIFLAGSALSDSAAILTEIEHALEGGATVLIVVPTEEMIELWQQRCRAAHLSVTLYRSQGSVATVSETWTVALTGRPQIVLGLRSSVFLPFHRLGLSVIEEAGHTQHREEQFPTYHSMEILRIRQRFFGGRILIRDPLPPLSILRRDVRKHWSFPRKKQTGPRIFIADEINPKSLNPNLDERMRHTLERQERVLVIVPDRGLAAGLACRSCQTIARCPVCDTVLHVPESRAQPFCFRCQQDYPLSTCPTCHAPDLLPFALGAAYWQAEFERRFPDPLRAYWQIVSPAFGGIPHVTADLSILIEPERLLGAHHWQTSWWYLRTLWDIRSKTRQELAIQTSTPDQTAKSALATSLPLRLLIEELKRRFEHHYPPYGRLLKIRTTKPREYINTLIEQTLRISPQIELMQPLIKTKKEYTLTLKIPESIPDQSFENLVKEYTKIGTIYLMDD